MYKKRLELKGIYVALAALSLILPLILVAILLYKSFESGASLTLQRYRDSIFSGRFMNAFGNSFTISDISALVTTLLVFLMAYIIDYTNISQRLEKGTHSIVTLPMLLPTTTYDFAIVYTLGKQGSLSKLLHVQLFDIYSFNGPLIGYMIYTLPIVSLLASNTMRSIDKESIIVSKIIGDSGGECFWVTTLSSMAPTLAAASLQAFFLSFTDFGIPMAVDGEFAVITTTLYDKILSLIPNFDDGAVIAMMILFPSTISIVLLNYPERYNVRYDKISRIELPEDKGCDLWHGFGSGLILYGILLIFTVVILLPFAKERLHDISFSLQHFTDTLANVNLPSVYRNSLIVLLGIATCGTMVVYGSTLVTTRGTLPILCRKSTDAISSIASTVPGMVIGIALLFTLSGTPLQSTFWIIIPCNMTHFFSTSYVMVRNTLGKLNISYEITAILMGDSWLKTIRRMAVPNSKSMILETLSYYFINSMVTVPALIFIVGAKTAVLTTKIKELQHFTESDQIFVLSLLILLTSLLVKGIILFATQRKDEKKVESVRVRRYALSVLAGSVVLFAFVLEQGGEPVAIYSNADEEALVAIQHVLDENDFQGQYVLQPSEIGELGGRIMTEGKSLEADIITVSSYYIDSAQQRDDMFDKLTFPTPTLRTYSGYDTSLTALEGATIVSTSVLKEKQLPMPSSLRELTSPKYKGLISMPDIKVDSTGWLFAQALLDIYGEEDGREILTAVLDDVGPHLESSGSDPLKKVRSGRVDIAFGLRHQALVDKGKRLPIDYIDPTEGNYSPTESVAVVRKENVNKIAVAMARCITENGRRDILHTYPIILYGGEQVEKKYTSKYPRVFEGALSVESLEKHRVFFEGCRK